MPERLLPRLDRCSQIQDHSRFDRALTRAPSSGGIEAVTQGHLLVLEGPDGVGKSSTVRGVAERLRSLAIRHSVLAFPGREPSTLGKLVYEIHHDPKCFGIEGMAEAAKQALHIAAHFDAIERRIGPLLCEGEHVLLDRFWWSTWVYGVIGGVSMNVLEALIEAERIQWGSIQPSVVVLLDRDAPIARDERPLTLNTRELADSIDAG